MYCTASIKQPGLNFFQKQSCENACASVEDAPSKSFSPHCIVQEDPTLHICTLPWRVRTINYLY